MSKATGKEPTHRIYAVAWRGTPRASWTDIGMVFVHADGKGFDLELHSMPLSAPELVARITAEKRRADGSIAVSTRPKPQQLLRASPSQPETQVNELCL